MQNGKSVKSVEPREKGVFEHKQKSKFWAYFWWLFGGILGAHHFYLNRDDHGLIYFCTLGGYFGMGWLRDLFKIPTYVADANNDRQYLDWFTNQVRNNKKVIDPIIIYFFRLLLFWHLK